MGVTESWRGGNEANLTFIVQGRLSPWSGAESLLILINGFIKALKPLSFPPRVVPVRIQAPKSLLWVPATPQLRGTWSLLSHLPPGAFKQTPPLKISHNHLGPAWNRVKIPSVNGTALFYLKCLYTMESAGMLFHILHIYTSTTSHLILLIKLFLKVFHLLLLTATSTLG